jgi:hypothetical protein
MTAIGSFDLTVAASPTIVSPLCSPVPGVAELARRREIAVERTHLLARAGGKPNRYADGTIDAVKRWEAEGL